MRGRFNGAVLWPSAQVSFPVSVTPRKFDWSLIRQKKWKWKIVSERPSGTTVGRLAFISGTLTIIRLQQILIPCFQCKLLMVFRHKSFKFSHMEIYELSTNTACQKFLWRKIIYETILKHYLLTRTSNDEFKCDRWPSTTWRHFLKIFRYISTVEIRYSTQLCSETGMTGSLELL